MRETIARKSKRLPLIRVSDESTTGRMSAPQSRATLAGEAMITEAAEFRKAFSADGRTQILKP
jgi:hypothetical protein